MRSHPLVIFGAALVLVAGVGLSGGCVEDTSKKNPYSALRPRDSTGPQQAALIDPTAVPVRDDIAQIQQIWPIMPWLRDTSSGKPVGFRCIAYFVSRQTEKGAFVSGPIVISLSEVTLRPGGEVDRRLLHTWDMDQAQATGFRVRKLAVGGYHYGFMLRWPDDLKLSGKRIEIQIGYRRSDGVLVAAAPHSMQVIAPAATPAPAAVRGTE